MDRKMTIVIRDTNGNVINIGPWDDKGGANPLPAGATQANEAVTTAPDGGLAAVSDPVLADKLKVEAVRLNNRRRALITAIKNSDDAQLIAAIAARYPALNGDAIKAVTDLALLAAAAIRD
jgi:hypothetical protein